MFMITHATTYTYYLYSMKNYPRWRNLKHFNEVTTKEFNDGEAYFHILKVHSSLVKAVAQLRQFHSRYCHVLYNC
jgi:hypothetical protein